MCLIRRATDVDADAVAVIRSAIQKSCTADHQNDPETLERWLRNKTPEQFRQWVNDPESFFVVAIVDSEIVGVGSGRSSGELDLCYVRPDRQREGVGSQILQSLEFEARSRSISKLRLVSTASARAFYEHHGYQFDGAAPASEFGLLDDYFYSKAFHEML